MAQLPDAKLQIDKTVHGEITHLRFLGTIDEDFGAEALVRGLTGTLVVSLSEVRRITSFGIRQWLDFISRASTACAQVYLVECAPRIVDQLNMVSNFAGRGVVVSFFAPFRCEYCANESVKLFQVDLVRESLQAHRLEGGACPNDGHPEILDDDPESFLSYLGAQAPFEVDPQVASFLAARTGYAVPEGLRRIRVEKKVRERNTFISLSGDLGDDLPAAKISEGLEGDVVFDLAGVGRASPEGLARWRTMLATIAPATERLLVIGLPATILESLTRREDLAEKGQVLSLFLPYGCRSCAVTSQQEIDVAKHYDRLRLGAAPEMACPDCGKPTACVASEGMLAKLTELPQPAADLKTEKLTKWARTKAPRATTEVPALRAPAPAPAVIPSRGWAALLGIAGAAVLVAVVAILLVLRDRARPVDVLEKSATVVEASHPKAPPWRDQTFTVRGDGVQVVGQSGFVRDKELGFKRARAAALEELSQQVAQSIRDPLWVEHVGSQFASFRSKAIGDLERALVSGEEEAIQKARHRVETRREAVARSFEKAASTVQPEQSQFYWEKLNTSQGLHYRVWSLFSLQKAGFKRICDHYSQRGTGLGATAVAYFPGMAWRYNLESGAVVVALQPQSPLRFVGLLAGDIVVSAQDRAIHDGRAFERVLTQEHGDLEREGGILMLRIQRGDSPIVDHRLQIAKKDGAGPPSKLPGKRDPKVTPGKKLPPANIWDDNPYE